MGLPVFDNQTTTSATVMFDPKSSTTPPPLQWRDVTFNVDFAILLLSLLITIIWFTFLTFYLSRVFGVIVTWAFNSFSRHDQVQVGSVSISVLSGKLMFRNFKYFSEDFTVRIQDGWFVFRYWRRYVSRPLGEDFSHEDPRLLCRLNGVEVHVYNQTQKYSRLSEVFGLGLSFGGGGKEQRAPVKKAEEPLKKRQQKWRSLIPVFHYEISSGRFSCGNLLLPSTLMITLENAVGNYTSKPPSRPESEDWFMHSLKGTCENFRVALVKTPKYAGQSWEEPPRTMGEGFVVLQTAQLEYYYYQDHLGIVKKERFQNLKENAPAWGTDFRLGKNTIISYGPWADNQRDLLYKFFFPSDYQIQQTTKVPCKQAKERRIYNQYDIRVSTLNDSTMDILFMRGEEPNAVHFGLKQGSYLEISVPWVIKEDGYGTKITGQLMHMEASTSLEYRPLMECETLQFSADLKYPRAWNGHQHWNFSFTGCKSTVSLVFSLKHFLHDLINEWADQTPPDLLKFVPWTCRFNTVLQDFELILAGLNDHNWIDTSSIEEENVQAGICGKRLELGFGLPFTTFQPQTTKVRFGFNGEDLELRVRIPEQHILRHVLKNLDAPTQIPQTNTIKTKDSWRGMTKDSSGWLNVWTAPQAMLSLVYDFHSMPNRRQSNLPDWAKKELEEDVASLEDFDPTQMEPDRIAVEVELGPSQVQFSAIIVKLIFALKDNYFGECDRITNIECFKSQTVKAMYGKVSEENFDARKCRPLHVTLSLVLHNIQANCMLYSAKENCPVGYVEQLAFEMDKRYLETRLQLSLSPVLVRFSAGKTEGQLGLSAFQLRGHAMFSHNGLPTDSPTSEYAWLLEIILGDLVGRISPTHLVQTVRFLETFVFMLTNSEEDLPYPKMYELCQHMKPKSICLLAEEGQECSTEHGLKYKLARISLDTLDLFVAEEHSVMELSSTCIRFATCNLHSAESGRGISCRVPSVFLKQFVIKKDFEKVEVDRGEQGANWLECGLFQLKDTDFSLVLPMLESEYSEKRLEFVRRHDDSRKRLTFLWDDHSNECRCGCVGGCAFFGKNLFGRRFFGDLGSFAVLAVYQNENAATWDDPGFGQSILRRGEPIITRSGLCPSAAESFMVTGPQLTTADSLDYLQEEFFLAPETWDEQEVTLPSPSNGSRGSLESFRTTVSKPETSLVNLYGQVNRPILTSPMLMTGYGKYLSQYSCDNWNEQPRLPRIGRSDFDFGRDLKYIPEFTLVKEGFNSMALVQCEGNRDVDLISQHQKQGRSKSDSGRNKQDRHRKRSKSPGKDANSLIGPQKKSSIVEAAGKIGESLEVLISPLGVEVVQRLLDSCNDVLRNPHPAYLIHSLFDSCSSSRHRQPLIRSKEASETPDFTSIQVLIRLPRVNVSLFQCGVVEKMVPFGDLSTITSLTQASAVLATLSGVTWSMSGSEGDDSEKTIVGSANIESMNCQLVQIADRTSSNMGISKSASRSPFCVNWDALGSVADQYKPCVITECCIRSSCIKLSKKVDGRKLETEKVGAEAAEKQAEASTSKDAQEERSEERSGKKIEPKSAETCVVVEIGPAVVNFGLCQPVDTTDESWPLYDLLAPSLTAWVHVVHRLEVVAVSLLHSVAVVKELTLAWLLTEALESSEKMNVYNPPRSKLAVAKQNHQTLRSCPSCQVLLVLLRFCAATAGDLDISERMEVPEEMKKLKNARKGLVALLSHWRLVLCYEKLVTLDSSLARKTMEDFGAESERDKIMEETRISIESPSPPPMKIGAMANRKRPSEFSTNLGSSPSTDSEVDKEEELKKPAKVGKRMGSSGSTGRTARTRSDNGLTDGPTSLNGSRKHGSRGKDGSFQKEDLYKWMRDQPKSEDRRARSQVVREEEEVNPMDIPLSVYFKRIFQSEHLEIGSDLSRLLDTLGGSLGFSVELQDIKVATVEPKFLSMIGSSCKQIGYTERPFLELGGIEASGVFTNQAELRPTESVTGFPVHRVTRQLNYHASCQKVCLSAGFPTASFLNQVSFVVRSVMDSHSELKRATPSAVDEGSSIMGTPLFKPDMSNTTDSGSGEKERPWCLRMMGLLNDYQKSQVRIGKKQSKLRIADLSLSLVICGVVDFSIINVQGMLRELVVYITMNKFQLGHSARERKSLEEEGHRVAELSLTGSMHRGIFILSEIEKAEWEMKARESKSVIFQLTVNDSRLLLSRQLRKGSVPDAWQNSLLVEVGPVMGDVPMHPGFLHGVVMRTSRNIQREFERLNAPAQVVVEEVANEKKREETVGHYSRSLEKAKNVAVVNFSISVCSLSVTASLLPSLKATYRFEDVSSSGTTGSEAKFVVEVPKHGITFDVQGVKDTPDGPLQPIKLGLPRITANGAYIQSDAADNLSDSMKDRALVYQQGGYLKIEVSVGKFEHTLTTYLLNQLLFVQEAFRREIGDIVSRITAEREPLFRPRGKKILFSVGIRGPQQSPLIQLTATTPTSTAVRLTVEQVFGQLTNRWVKKAEKERGDRLYGTVSVELSLVLGQFIKNAMFEEVEPEFQQFAYFKTNIQVQNVETETDLWKDTGPSYTYLIRVHRPIVFIQPSAVDKAVLLWLNYRNTYEFWNEQRQQIRTNRRISFLPEPSQMGIGNVPLFLKLSVDSGIYICMPLYSAQYPDTNSALLLSLAKTDIEVCSRGSLVSRGSFTGFCIRFVEDFDAVAENWRPEGDRPEGSNACFVPEGTYNVCSRTSAPRSGNANAEWVLNVKWQMKGMDLELNTRIGKLTSLLLATLTSLAGEGEESLTVPGSERASSIVSDVVENVEEAEEAFGDLHSLPPGKKRTKAIEKAMNDQARIVTDLKDIGATEATIELERRKLQKLEAALFTEFRKEMVEKLRRQSQKATSLKDRLGLAVKPPSSVSRNISTDSRFGSVEPVHGWRRLSELHVNRRHKLSHVRAGSLDAGFRRLPSISGSENESPTSSESTETDIVGDSHYEEDDPTSPSTVRFRSPPTSHLPEETAAPAVDLYLDVEINVEKGGCTLRTQSKEEASEGGGVLTGRTASGKGDKKRLTPRSALQLAPVTETVIAMPSLVVKSYYASHSGAENSTGLNVHQLREDGLDEQLISHMKSSSKKGNLFMSIALESMPQETVVSSHMMDFLQETIEAVPFVHHFLPPRKPESESNVKEAETMKEDATKDEEAGEGQDSTLTLEAATAAVVSFPVDIVLYFSVQQSSIRFTSQPFSMMECLLKLPQLQLMCSSRKASDLLCMDASAPRVMPKKLSALNLKGLIGTEVSEDHQYLNSSEMLNGGIYCAAVLKEFSLCIFHPFGADPSQGVTKEGSRDALGLSVDKITINISRSRNVLTAANWESEKGKLKNSVRFSLLVAIGKASFKYDMRRLKEILSFPKPWYRKAIWRRLFLGDESTGGSSAKGLGSGTVDGGSRPHTPRTEKTTDSRESGGQKIEHPSPVQNESAKTAWEALVLFTVTFAELEIEANMGQTMGLTSWVTKSVSWMGNLDLNSRGCNNILLGLSLDSSVLDAKTGVISGSVSLSQLGLNASMKRPAGRPPEVVIGACLGTSETRMEWMSSIMLIARCTDLNLELKDEWRTETGEQGVERCDVHLLGSIRWGEMQMLISKTTVNDLVRMYHKLREFFQQQLKSGRYVLLDIRREKEVSEGEESRKEVVEPVVIQRHHRHWQKALALITEIQILPSSFFPLPTRETVVGGTLDISGAEISLGCFHGDFRAIKWAVFHMKQPMVSFESNAKDVVLEKNEIGTLITQVLMFSLGGHSRVRTDETMAIVALARQGRYSPPATASLREWLDYALNSVISQMYPKKGGKEMNSVLELLKLPATQVQVSSMQRQTDAEPEPGDPRPVVEFSFVSQFCNHLMVLPNVEELYFLQELVNSYVQEKQQPAPSTTSKTSLRGTPTQELQMDGRDFELKTLVLEPSLCLMDWKQQESFATGEKTGKMLADKLLDYLGLKKPETIPKWTQRGLMDPSDSTLALLMENMLMIAKKMQ